MTTEEVLQVATLFGPGERLELWSTCGTHDLSALSHTAAGASGESLRYCERCLCVWTADGAVLNQPKGHARGAATRQQGTPGAQPGPPVAVGNSDLKGLSDQVAQIAQELQAQLTRITQIQAQLDRLAGGQAPNRRDPRAADRVQH